MTPSLILLDTNAVSDLLKGGSTGIRERYQAATAWCSFSISTIAEAELYFGLERRPEKLEIRAQVEYSLQNLTILPWDSAAARQYGRLRTQLERAGTPLSEMDTLIAAHALSLSMPLLTSDRAFSQIPQLHTITWLDLQPSATIQLP